MTPLSVNAFSSILTRSTPLFTISNFLACSLFACLYLACCLIPVPPKAPLAPPCPPHPQTSPRSSLYCFIFYSDQYVHPPQCTVHLCTVHLCTVLHCTVHLCTVQPSFAMVSPVHLTHPQGNSPPPHSSTPYCT